MNIRFLFAFLASLIISSPAMASENFFSFNSAPIKVNMKSLNDNGTIVIGNTQTSDRVVTVFTDFKCGPCMVLIENLRALDIVVIERPISVISSKAHTIQAFCALRDVDIANCDTRGLEANDRFAKSHGFKSVPIMVRDDGSVMEGSQPKLILESWIRFRWP